MLMPKMQPEVFFRDMHLEVSLMGITPVARYAILEAADNLKNGKSDEALMILQNFLAATRDKD